MKRGTVSGVRTQRVNSRSTKEVVWTLSAGEDRVKFLTVTSIVNRESRFLSISSHRHERLIRMRIEDAADTIDRLRQPPDFEADPNLAFLKT